MSRLKFDFRGLISSVLFSLFVRMPTVARVARRTVPVATAEALLPTVLTAEEDESTYSLAALGTCVAEGFSVSATEAPARIDFYLMGSGLHDPIPDVCWERYDAILVHLTLRDVLQDDLFHVRPYADYDARCRESFDRLKTRMEKITDIIGRTAPVFFLAFSEPPSSYQGILLNNRRDSLYRLVRTLNDGMADIAGSLSSAYYVEINDVMRYLGDGNLSDAYTNHLSHAGFIDICAPNVSGLFSAIATRVCNGIKILRADNPVKLIISDLDNTLWKGVLAECDNIVPHEHTEGWPLGYVEALLEFKRRGGLLAISSKNELDSTIPRFNAVWNNRLRMDDFCSIKINWRAKSSNIAEILNETNIMASNTLFIDDNPREIEEVRRIFPDMRFLSGRQDTWRGVILFSPHTQVAAISAESHARTELVHAKQKRDQLSSKLSRTDYLKTLAIRVSFEIIDSISQERFERAIELINKTNQFNTTGRRWTISDSRRFFKDAGKIWLLSKIRG